MLPPGSTAELRLRAYGDRSFACRHSGLYHEADMELTAFVLAGGKSTRMGKDKAFLQLAGRTLLERALALARELTPNVYILGPAAKFGAYGSTVEDIFPECGPLGGIHSALSVTTTELNLILAVDAPFVRPEFLRYLVAEAARTQALATLARITSIPRSTPAFPLDSGREQTARIRRRRSNFQPLCAVYRRGFREIAENALRQGHNKIDPLFAEAEVRIVTESELASLSLPLSMFANINTPEELERAAIDCEE